MNTYFKLSAAPIGAALLGLLPVPSHGKGGGFSMRSATSSRRKQLT